jgi:RNA polymerase sigma-70 factor (ECF subfamily)
MITILIYDIVFLMSSSVLSSELIDRNINSKNITIDGTTQRQKLNQQVTQLYSEHHSWLSIFLYRKLGCNQKAADLSHDVFVRILKKKHPLDLLKPRAYLTTIAHSLVVNHWRRCDIEKAYLDAIASHGDSYAPSAEDTLIVIETLSKIDAALSGLPIGVKQAFLLSQLDGLTYKAIAKKLNVSDRTIKNYMARAMMHCLITSN